MYPNLNFQTDKKLNKISIKSILHFLKNRNSIKLLKFCNYANAEKVSKSFISRFWKFYSNKIENLNLTTEMTKILIIFFKLFHNYCYYLYQKKTSFINIIKFEIIFKTIGLNRKNNKKNTTKLKIILN